MVENTSTNTGTGTGASTVVYHTVPCSMQCYTVLFSGSVGSVAVVPAATELVTAPVGVVPETQLTTFQPSCSQPSCPISDLLASISNPVPNLLISDLLSSLVPTPSSSYLLYPHSGDLLGTTWGPPRDHLGTFWRRKNLVLVVLV